MSTSSLAASSVEDVAEIGRSIAPPPDLESRLRSLAEIDKKVYEVLEISKEILQSYDKERQISRTKMEDLYKKYEKCIEDINTGIGAQLNYAENMCTGAEHQGSTVMFHQLTDQAKNRVDSLLNELHNLAHDANTSFRTTTQHDNGENYENERQGEKSTISDIPYSQEMNEKNLAESETDERTVMSDVNSELLYNEEDVQDEEDDEPEILNYSEEPEEEHEADQIISEDDVKMDSEEDDEN